MHIASFLIVLHCRLWLIGLYHTCEHSVIKGIANQKTL